MTTALQIRQRLEAILEFMQPHWEFVNCHMVGFITESHWERQVPLELRLEVPNIQRVQHCIEGMFWRSHKDDSFPAFSNFLKLSEQHRLENFSEILTSAQELNKVLNKEKVKEKISIKEFMSEKKRHEVEITAELVDDLIQKHLSHHEDQDVFVIDAGDGKGYLSSRLVLQYNHKVLGIDWKESNTENALERSRKLQRAWNGLTERAELENKGITPPRRGNKLKNKLPESCKKQAKVLENYKTTSKFITTDLDFEQLLKEFFPASMNTCASLPPAICLTGLHTCGNLAPTCLQVFHAQPQFKLLCNIGCCYHLLKESYSGQEFYGNKAIMDLQSEAGFPLSQFLLQKRFKLGRNARMLAAQSIERTMVSKELPNISLFYRALLEVLVCERNAELKDTLQVGKVKKFKDFKEYLELCGKKEQFSSLEAFEADRIDSVQLQHADDRHYLDLFYLLRMSFAPVLESLILLDRLLYLKELGYERSYLISVFDAVISPRHFGIVAMKD